MFWRGSRTRGSALVPAFLGVLWLGEGGVGKLLVASQVVLSFSCCLRFGR